MNHPAQHPPSSKPPCTRADALSVLNRLRDAGHVAYFAGGCVRDLLLGREPKDWDVATNAPPTVVRKLFNNTQAVGAAFGVILVHYHRSVVEVATFRADAEYVDGRHPTGVRFTTAEEDAQRRDFTINGLFLDPLKHGSLQAQVIDHVGGRADLAAGLIRAIGDPEARFREDHLRMLRAVRFAARFGFTIEPGTAGAIRRHAAQLIRISPERIADELRIMLCSVPAPNDGDLRGSVRCSEEPDFPRSDPALRNTSETGVTDSSPSVISPGRVYAYNMLEDLGLRSQIFRFLELPTGDGRLSKSASVFSALAASRQISFGLALAGAAIDHYLWNGPINADVRRLFEKPISQKIVRAYRQSLKISNDESADLEGVLEGLDPLLGDTPPTVARMKRFLARPTSGGSRILMSALLSLDLLDPERAQWLEARLAELEKTDFAPPPLITGDDLATAGIVPGPIYKRILDTAYDEQLEGRISSRDEAMELAMKVASAQLAG